MKQDNTLIDILLADDDADDRDFFQQALQEAGIPSTLTTFVDGQKLVDYLAGILDPPPPDIIFLDINMPRKDGKACLRAIRSDERFRHVPVIMFSTSFYGPDIDETFRNGANLYLSKADFFEDEAGILKRIFSRNWSEQMRNVPKEKFLFK